MDRFVSGDRRAIDCALRPRSVAVIGVSETPGSAGRNAVRNLIGSGYGGAIHIVSRSGATEGDIAPVAAIEELPSGIDLAILAVPASAVLDAVKSCAARGVGVAVIFASGFAELGAEGRTAQAALSEAASAGGMALIGPNCLGYSSRAAGISVGFGPGGMSEPEPVAPPAVAILAQSGGMMANANLVLGARGITVSHAISTGNEAMIGVEDFLADIANDSQTGAVILYAEQVRDPVRFLAAIRSCAGRGKAVVMLHPGRSDRAKEAAYSHSGAMAGDYQAMRVLATHAGAIFVETLEALVDVAEMMARTGQAPTRGVGVLTASGAVCGVALDYCDRIGLDVPRLEPATVAALTAVLPPFAQPANPLDLTTQPQREPELLGKGLQALMDDPNIGSVVIAITPGGPAQSVRYFDGLQPALGLASKPLTLAIMGDGSPLTDEFMGRVRDARVAFARSPERALRTMAALTGHGRVSARAGRADPRSHAPASAARNHEAIAEFHAKAALDRLGIAVPAGALAKDLTEARRIAERIGYPVALKAQSPALLHKTDAGGVALHLADAKALGDAWEQVSQAVARAAPGVALDGMLVEAMAPPGLDLIAAGRRVAGWGAVVMVGLGGIWTEMLGDFRLMPAGLAPADIVEEIDQLRAAALLSGGRGAAPLDKRALAETIARIGAAMLADEGIGEIELNPLRLYPSGAIALDGLMRVAPGWGD